jgi:hypothetical protein
MKKTSITWLLTNQAKNPKTNETIYTYMDTDGRIFKMEPHPKKPFTYYTEASESVSNKEQSKILDTYIENGMNQDQFIGGFQEAISKITF